MKISIMSMATISPLGSHRDAPREYRKADSALQEIEIGDQFAWAGLIPAVLKEKLRAELPSKYDKLDPTVQYAIWTARAAVEQAGWTRDMAIGLNVGSSRGATNLWESYHRELLQSGWVGTPASPTTTLGNIASWVAHDLGTRGPAFSHSITCSSALHAVLNGCAWLQAGYADAFLAGGSEAPLTPFTMAQMQALKIYSREMGPYPCRPLDDAKAQNTMVLGEGAGMLCLEKGELSGARALISGIGYATEPLEHGASLSSDATCLKDAMGMALTGTDLDTVDAVILHAPGTLKGDRAEQHAISRIFGPIKPVLCTNKWKIGHTLGASGLLSLEMAILMLEAREAFPAPYLEARTSTHPIQKVLINAVGFGGNAVSILLESIRPARNKGKSRGLAVKVQ